ncbi:MAG: type II secretion system F family protein [Acidimicrobiales bacterium]
MLRASLGTALATHLLVGARRWPWRAADLDRGRSGDGSAPDHGALNEKARDDGAGEADGGFRRSDPTTVRWRRRMARGRRSGRIDPPTDLVACLDLFFVAATAELTIVGAMTAVGSSGTGATSEAFGAAATDVRRGLSIAAVLDGVVDALGPPIQPLISVLASAVSSGTPVAGAVQRLADIERSRERRRMEVRARRLPVLMLVPLVGLVLPAFVLLTVAPVAIALADGFPA